MTKKNKNHDSPKDGNRSEDTPNEIHNNREYEIERCEYVESGGSTCEEEDENEVTAEVTLKDVSSINMETDLINAYLESLNTDIKHLKMKANRSPCDTLSRSIEDDVECTTTTTTTRVEKKLTSKTTIQRDLYDAVYKGYTYSVKKFLKRPRKKVKINSYTEKGWTLLHVACDQGHTDIVKLLIKHGADVNQALKEVDINFTPLHTSTKAGFADIVQILIDNGAEINKKLVDGYTALHVAVEFAEYEVIDVLLESGAEVNARIYASKKTSLDLARDSGNKELINQLMSVCQNCGARARELSTCSCGQVKYCSESCASADYEHHKYLHELSLEEPLRFKVGERVRCKMANDTHATGTVVRHWYRLNNDDYDEGQEEILGDREFDYHVPYRVMLDETHRDRDDVMVYVPYDDAECIEGIECNSDKGLLCLLKRKEADAKYFNDLKAYLFGGKSKKISHLVYWDQNVKFD